MFSPITEQEPLNQTPPRHPLALYNAMITHETKGHAAPSTATSGKGAKGYFQVRDIALKELHNKGISKHITAQMLTDPNSNIEVGVNYLNLLEDMYPNNPDKTMLALAMYNGGPKMVRQIMRENPNATWGEVRKLLPRQVSKYADSVKLMSDYSTDPNTFVPELRQHKMFNMLSHKLGGNVRKLQLGTETRWTPNYTDEEGKQYEGSLFPRPDTSFDPLPITPGAVTSIGNGFQLPQPPVIQGAEVTPLPTLPGGVSLNRKTSLPTPPITQSTSSNVNTYGNNLPVTDVTDPQEGNKLDWRGMAMGAGSILNTSGSLSGNALTGTIGGGLQGAAQFGIPGAIIGAGTGLFTALKRKDDIRRAREAEYEANFNSSMQGINRGYQQGGLVRKYQAGSPVSGIGSRYAMNQVSDTADDLKARRKQYYDSFIHRQLKASMPYLDKASLVPILGRFPAALLAGMHLAEGDLTGSILNGLASISHGLIKQESAIGAKMNQTSNLAVKYHKAHVADEVLNDHTSTPAYRNMPIKTVRSSTLVDPMSRGIVRKFEKGGVNINTTGYTPGTPTFYNDHNVIPGNIITTANTPMALEAIADTGERKILKPFRKKKYIFRNAKYVIERPLI